MGTTLHDKIYLGRASLFGVRRVRIALVATLCAGIALAWLMAPTLR